MSMDPRIAARRREVIEGSARRSLVRLAKVLAVVLVLVGSGWLVQSEPFRVGTIEVYGAERAAVDEILTAGEVVPGRPMLLVRAGALEAALLDDPWVVEAKVGLTFPDLVDVTVRERAPAAWLMDGGAGVLLAGDGVVVPGGDVADTLPLVRIGGLPDTPVGDRVEDARVAGALEFLTTLDPLLATRGSLTEREGGELWFSIPGLEVRLGRPVEMAEKAAALAALLERGVPPGAEVNLIAPTRPAVATTPPPEG